KTTANFTLRLVGNACPPDYPLGSSVHSANSGGQAAEYRVADAQAVARIGSIGAYASTAWSIPGNLRRDSINAYATAEASWHDTITINAPGHNGQSGLWSGVLNLTGSGSYYVQDADPDRPAYAFNDIDVKAPGLQPISTRCGEGPPKFVVGEACFRQINSPRETMSLPFVMQIVLGQPQNFYATLRADSLSAGLQCPGCPTFASVAFNHTLNWGGTSSVRDASGQLLGSYTMSSDSGMDYRVAAVPEPASWLMLLFGLALTLPLARRRRS
ncbi:PEP-CTERM sorting domain-containing protein, partial [Chitinivorax sp. PXF-14]|uniref:PEP-CTERM sorting domain-containing protein n=1 Tax=Chitinivorax sp. PXF-14 TaxID=3230488 RepID=UPI003466F003